MILTAIITALTLSASPVAHANCNILKKLFKDEKTTLKLDNINTPIHSIAHASLPEVTQKVKFSVQSTESSKKMFLMEIERFLTPDEIRIARAKQKHYLDRDFVSKEWSLNNGVLEATFYRPETVNVSVKVGPVLDFDTRNRYKAFKAFDAKNQEAIYSRIREMNRKGYDLERITQRKQKMTFNFRRNPELANNPIGKVDAKTIDTNRKMLKALEGLKPPKQYYDLDIDPASVNRVTASPKGFRVNPRYTQTVATDQPLAFTLLRGEASLRVVDVSHKFSSGLQEVEAAGELLFKRNAAGEITELWLRPSSGHFKPDTSSLSRAVQAVWQQGVYPKKIKIFSDIDDTWDNLVFESR